MRALILDGDGATLVMSQAQYKRVVASGLAHLLHLAPSPWRALEFCLGHTVAEVPGVVNHLAKLMADENISILHHSTYSAEIFLVQAPELASAVRCIRERVDAALHGVLAAHAERIGSVRAGTDSEGGSPSYLGSPVKREGGEEDGGDVDRKMHEIGVSRDGEGEGRKGREGGTAGKPASLLSSWVQKLRVGPSRVLPPSSSPPSRLATPATSGMSRAASSAPPSFGPSSPAPGPSLAGLLPVDIPHNRGGKEGGSDNDRGAGGRLAASEPPRPFPSHQQPSWAPGRPLAKPSSPPSLSTSPFSTFVGPTSPPLTLRVMPQSLVLARLNQEALPERSDLLARLLLFDRLAIRRFGAGGGGGGGGGRDRGQGRETPAVMPDAHPTPPSSSSSSSGVKAGASASIPIPPLPSSSLNPNHRTPPGARSGWPHTHRRPSPSLGPVLPPDLEFGPLALVEMEGEVTLLLEEETLPLFPPLALLPCPLRWRALKLCGRPFGFEETGLVAAMCKMDDATPLLNFSTFLTNFTLVEEEGVEETVGRLRQEVGAGLEG